MEFLADGFKERSVAEVKEVHLAAAASDGHRITRSEVGLQLAVRSDYRVHSLAG